MTLDKEKTQPGSGGTQNQQHKGGRFEIYDKNNVRGRGSRGGHRERGEQDEFDQKVVDIARVTRVTKGGKRFTFRATIIAGNNKGMVGMGLGRGSDVSAAISKGFRDAKKKAVKVRLVNGTIPYDISEKYNSAVVLLRPAKRGNGVKAGGVVRIIAKLCGISDLTAKIISRTTNKINLARATIGALSSFKMDKQKEANVN